MEEILDFLIERGLQLLNTPYQTVRFTRDNGADNLLNNLNNYPHAFVLACVMDRQIRAERAWRFPMSNLINGVVQRWGLLARHL